MTRIRQLGITRAKLKFLNPRKIVHNYATKNKIFIRKIHNFHYCDRSWKAAKGMMGNVGEFLSNLVNFDKNNIHALAVKAMDEYMKDPEFDPEFVRSKSSAAAGLCSWAINIIKYFEVYCEVKRSL